MLTTRLTGCFVIGACVLQNLFLVHEMCLLSKQTLRMTLLAFTFVNILIYAFILLRVCTEYVLFKYHWHH